MDKYKRLKDARQRAKLSQAKLAEIGNLSQGQLSRMERGVMWASNEAVARLAAAVGIPVADLLDVDGLAKSNMITIDSAAAIIESKASPRGLKELAKDQSLTDALKIVSAEWVALASVIPPSNINKQGYVALLTTLRSVTKS